jgi:hypothetical protein
MTNHGTWMPEQFWEYVGGLAGDWEAEQMRRMMQERGLTLAAARPAQKPTREQIAKAIYGRWLNAPDDRVAEHFAWYHEGEGRADSCVHYSTVAKALSIADAVMALTGEESK